MIVHALLVFSLFPMVFVFIRIYSDATLTNIKNKELTELFNERGMRVVTVYVCDHDDMVFGDSTSPFQPFILLSLRTDCTTINSLIVKTTGTVFIKQWIIISLVLGFVLSRIQVI
jgi:hypothetical protein